MILILCLNEIVGKNLVCNKDTAYHLSESLFSRSQLKSQFHFGNENQKAFEIHLLSYLWRPEGSAGKARRAGL